MLRSDTKHRAYKALTQRRNLNAALCCLYCFWYIAMYSNFQLSPRETWTIEREAGAIQWCQFSGDTCPALVVHSHAQAGQAPTIPMTRSWRKCTAQQVPAVQKVLDTTSQVVGEHPST